MNKTKKCKYCKSEIDSKAAFCPNCGRKQTRTTKIIITIVAVLVVISAIGRCAGTSDTNENLANTESPTVNSTVIPTEESESVSENNEPEHGTSAYVDYIAEKAKADALTATDDQLQEAVDWLKNNTTNYFSGNENMELTMYYGELLQYKYKDTGNIYEQVGWQAFKTVKYVYREAESVLDQVTHDNLIELQNMVRNLTDIK